MEKLDPDMGLSGLPKEKWWEDEYVYQLGGFWYMPQFIEPIQRVIDHFNPLPSDVIIATFPKSGTMWLKSMLFSIVHRLSKLRLEVEHPHELVPFLETQVFAQSDEPPAASDSRRIFGTHIHYQLLTETLDSCQCKVVYLAWNPKDTLVSLWHFVNKFDMGKPDQPWSLDEAIDRVCHGVIPYGPYYDHVVGYRELSMKRPEHVMFLTYEEMIEDPHGHVKKLGDFLGCPFEEGEEEAEEIVKNCSIEVLSNHDVNKSDKCPTWFPLPCNSFFRKGKIGDHKNYLSDESIQRIAALTKERFHSLGFMYGI